MATEHMHGETGEDLRQDWQRPNLSVFALAEVTQLGKLGSLFDGFGEMNFSED